MGVKLGRGADSSAHSPAAVGWGWGSWPFLCPFLTRLPRVGIGFLTRQMVSAA